jgi:hypothetical protein
MYCEILEIVLNSRMGGGRLQNDTTIVTEPTRV